jgi:hypothetical protein
MIDTVPARPDVKVEFPEGTALRLLVNEKDGTTGNADMTPMAEFLTAAGWHGREQEQQGVPFATLETDDTVVCLVDGTAVSVDDMLAACATALVEIITETVRREHRHDEAA